MDGVVLVLNQNYEPLNVCNLPRAFRLVFGEKAEVIEYDHQVIRTPRTSFAPVGDPAPVPDPAAAAAGQAVPPGDLRPRPAHCQYCGRQTHDLTLDHVVPRHRGGGHTWENLVAACKALQPPEGRQDDRRSALPPPAQPPFEPRSDVYSLFTPYLDRRPERGLADVPLPGSELSSAELPAPVEPASLGEAVPGGHDSSNARARRHAAYVVGGCSRTLLGRPPYDWDLATDALPGADRRRSSRRLREPVRDRGRPSATGGHEITTFRRDHDYADFRRPHRSSSGTSLEADLARRDFTAKRWPGERRRSDGLPCGSGRLCRSVRRRADVAARVLRAVGDPATRFEEDALRMVRAVRLAATLGFAIEPSDARRDPGRRALVAHLSGERIAVELASCSLRRSPSIGLG